MKYKYMTTGTGNPGFVSPYDQGYAEGMKRRAYDNPYDQPAEKLEKSEFRRGFMAALDEQDKNTKE